MGQNGRFLKIGLFCFYPQWRAALFKMLKSAPAQWAEDVAIMQWDGEALKNDPALISKVNGPIPAAVT